MNEDGFREKVAAGLAEVQSLLHARELAQQQAENKIDQLRLSTESRLREMQGTLDRLTEAVEKKEFHSRLQLIEQSATITKSDVADLQEENKAFRRWLIGLATSIILVLVGAVIQFFLRK